MSNLSFHSGAASVSPKSTAARSANCRAGRQVIRSSALRLLKVKRTAEERKGAGKDKLKEAYVRYKETNMVQHDGGKEVVKEMRKMCNEMLKSKKASEGGKTKAAPKNDD